MPDKNITARVNIGTTLLMIGSLWLPAFAQAPAPPQGGEALKQWLEAGHYKSWHAESDKHDSHGPHFGKVRAYLNPALFESMDTNAATHPLGAVAVKELFGDGDVVKGWAVGIKNSTSNGGGDNWYWYEWYDGSTVRDSQGQFLCSACHSTGRDYVLTPWPLQ